MANWESSSDPLSTSPGTVQQMKEQAKSLAHDAKEEVSNVAGQARDQVQGLVSQQKTRVADQLGSLAGALRDTGNQLGQKQSHLLDLGGYAGKAADKVDRLSSYLRDRELGEVVRDAETFARRRPELFLGGTFLAGLLLARFLKASGDAENLETGAVRAGQSYPRSGSLGSQPAYRASRPYTPPLGG